MVMGMKRTLRWAATLASFSQSRWGSSSSSTARTKRVFRSSPSWLNDSRAAASDFLGGEKHAVGGRVVLAEAADGPGRVAGQQHAVAGPLEALAVDVLHLLIRFDHHHRVLPLAGHALAADAAAVRRRRRAVASLPANCVAAMCRSASMAEGDW